MKKTFLLLSFVAIISHCQDVKECYECYSQDYIDSVAMSHDIVVDSLITYYEDKIPDTVYIQVEDSLVNLYKDSLHMCQYLLYEEFDGIDVVSDKYSFSVTDSSLQRVYVYTDSGYVNVKIQKGYSKIEFIFDKNLVFSYGELVDTIFVNDIYIEKKIVWPSQTDTIIMW